MDTWRLTAAIVSLTVLAGCASKPRPAVECPRYVPSPEALSQPQAIQWRGLADRMVETFSRPSPRH